MLTLKSQASTYWVCSSNGNRTHCRECHPAKRQTKVTYSCLSHQPFPHHHNHWRDCFLSSVVGDTGQQRWVLSIYPNPDLLSAVCLLGLFYVYRQMVCSAIRYYSSCSDNHRHYLRSLWRALRIRWIQSEQRPFCQYIFAVHRLYQYIVRIWSILE